MFKLARKAVSPIYAIYQRRLESKIKNGEVPNHLAVIMDGNRRYEFVHRSDEGLWMCSSQGFLR